MRACVSGGGVGFVCDEAGEYGRVRLVCECACVCACVGRVCVRECVCACMRACVQPAGMHTRIKECSARTAAQGVQVHEDGLLPL